MCGQGIDRVRERKIFCSESCSEMKNMDRSTEMCLCWWMEEEEEDSLRSNILDSNSIDCLFYSLLAAQADQQQSHSFLPCTGLNSWTYLAQQQQKRRRRRRRWGVTVDWNGFWQLLATMTSLLRYCEAFVTTTDRRIDRPTSSSSSNINRRRSAVVKVHLKKHAPNQTQSIVRRVFGGCCEHWK